ncbi:MAG: N-acetylmuramoyl-L-alanine amidase [Deltaproteobacteria bacterium]|nr:N-acetylmuramoyl-L-alanine amidase [Deltaproteobacteria bacterium]MBN2688617.1 N-acetylmuramoyl-L-alanine amidase [Deltaproteobacteria bacterium]
MMMKLCRWITVILITLILLPATAAAAHKYLVVVDPAHGGNDKGVQLTNTVYEKDITLIIAKQVQKEIGGKKGISIKLTRTGDTNLVLSERLRMARELKADLFISLHVNAGFGRRSSGYEIYFPGFKKRPKQDNGSREIVEDMVRNKFLNESVRFAQIAMKNIEPIFPRQGRGLRECPIPGFDKLEIAAVVIELGFATNVENRKKMTTSSTQKAIAEALGKSIDDYFAGLMKNGEK